METAFETDTMLTLLTDALRRGPGTPQWQNALDRLANDQLTMPNGQADEFRVLMTVRQRLEAGQHYREVRAGPAFTRELFQRIDAQTIEAAGEKYRRPKIAAMVAIVSLLGLFLSAALVIRAFTNARADEEALSTRLFTRAVASYDFTQSAPLGWTLVTPAPLGKRVFTLTEVMDISTDVCVETDVRYQPLDGGADVTLTNESSDSATAVSVSIDAQGVRVTGPGDTVLARRPLAPGAHTLRWRVNATHAAAELDGQILWAGPHSLGTRARPVLRFNNPDPAAVLPIRSVRILRP